MTINKKIQGWTIYMIVCPVILAISLIVAVYVSNDFHQDFFVKTVTFIGSNILLWTIFHVFISMPYEMMTAKRKATAMDEPVERLSMKEESSQPTPITYSHDDYVKSVETHENNAKEERTKCVSTILDYAHRTMSRFLYEEDLNTLIGEIRKWSEDCNYSPTPISRFRQNVENIPLRHFVWNIAERLGRREYSMAVRIGFVRTLFPKQFEGLDYSTLKNLKAPCSNDVIPIDEPTNGKCKFHDMAGENPE